MKRIGSLLFCTFLSLTVFNAAGFCSEILEDGTSKTAAAHPANSGLNKKEEMKWRGLSQTIEEVRNKAPEKKTFKKSSPETLWVDEKSPAGKKMKSNAAKNANAASGRTATQQMTVAEINRRLQDVIKLNDTIKADQSAKIAQLKAIEEQSRFQQEALKNLEKVKTTAPVFTPKDLDEVLRQEKIRMIREKAGRSQGVVKPLDQPKRS